MMRTSTSKSRPETVDEYLAAVPPAERAALARVRQAIRAAAPRAIECISYGIPSYKHQGMLVGFGASKNHCTFYVMSVTATRAHAVDLKRYTLGKGSVQFTPDKPLPAALVTKLVKSRIKENEAKRG
jgi:uncharacterized protein YdhG (YjbR/CyaY superfamily)